MITVKLFAILKDKAGTGEFRIPDSPATVGELLKEISRRYPSLAGIIAGGRLLISVNQEFARQETPLRDGDEVGLMPPFSGGGVVAVLFCRARLQPCSQATLKGCPTESDCALAECRQSGEGQS